MSVLRSIALFALAAVAEIGGAWMVWQGFREHRGLAWIGAGIAALAAYGFVATFQDDPNFGRILAAYGGIFVAGSLAWGIVSTASTGPLRPHRSAHLPRRSRRDHVRPPPRIGGRSRDREGPEAPQGGGIGRPPRRRRSRGP